MTSNTAEYSNWLFRTGFGAAVTCVAFSLLGCGSEKEVVDVQGRVTYQGQPVSTGTISFSPKSISQGASQRPATAALETDGTYRLKAYRNQFGMPPGEYVVSVLSYEGSVMEPSKLKYLVPKKYSEGGTSGLIATVPESHAGTLNLDFDIN